jgi:Undecaprenyl-phosphate glucose phosphotransferase
MLKKHAQFFESLFFISDLLVLFLAWILSYFLRFHTNFLIAPLLGTPPLSHYIEYLLPLGVIWALVSKRIRLYRPRRIESFLKETSDIIKCLTLTFSILVVTIYLFRSLEFSRLAFLYFWVMGFWGLTANRFFIRRALKALRARGFNQRFAVIAGTGELGQKILERIEFHPDLGIQVIGFLSHEAEEVGKRIGTIPIIGAYEDLHKIFGETKIDIFFVALPITEYDRLAFLLEELQSYSSDIKVIPGVYEFLGLRGGVDELDDLPIVSLQSSPLYGWNSVFKRIFDLIFGSLILIIASPFLLVISLLVKGTSKGPILYRQERVGMDGHLFQMLKFRTMRVDAEKKTGPIWAEKNDPRMTKVGAFLRRTSLDELPQLFNVLRGEMSLVGPRPERPNFVQEFRNRIPLYMLRHKIKAGMTGWAQVNGWRGNTSIERRIEHDLYYVQNWSILFDLRILLMTFRRGFFSKLAY